MQLLERVNQKLSARREAAKTEEEGKRAAALAQYTKNGDTLEEILARCPAFDDLGFDSATVHADLEKPPVRDSDDPKVSTTTTIGGFNIRTEVELGQFTFTVRFTWADTIAPAASPQAQRSGGEGEIYRRFNLARATSMETYEKVDERVVEWVMELLLHLRTEAKRLADLEAFRQEKIALLPEYTGYALEHLDRWSHYTRRMEEWQKTEQARIFVPWEGYKLYIVDSALPTAFGDTRWLESLLVIDHPSAVAERLAKAPSTTVRVVNPDNGTIDIQWITRMVRAEKVTFDKPGKEYHRLFVGNPTGWYEGKYPIYGSPLVEAVPVEVAADQPLVWREFVETLPSQTNAQSALVYYLQNHTPAEVVKLTEQDHF